MILFTLSYIYKEKNKHNRIYKVLYNRKSNKTIRAQNDLL